MNGVAQDALGRFKQAPLATMGFSHQIPRLRAASHDEAAIAA